MVYPFSTGSGGLRPASARLSHPSLPVPPEENQFEPSVLQYRFILDHTPAMLWTASLDGQVDYVNEWMVHYTGRPGLELFQLLR
jgi:hypothetical protein